MATKAAVLIQETNLSLAIPVAKTANARWLVSTLVGVELSGQVATAPELAFPFQGKSVAGATHAMQVSVGASRRARPMTIVVRVMCAPNDGVDVSLPCRDSVDGASSEVNPGHRQARECEWAGGAPRGASARFAEIRHRSPRRGRHSTSMVCRATASPPRSSRTVTTTSSVVGSDGNSSAVCVSSPNERVGLALP